MTPERVCLHGFLGNAHAWQAIVPPAAHRLILPGHGLNPVPAAPDFVGVVGQLAEQIAALASSPVHIVGYSLGARLALGLLVWHPQLCSSATLISVNPGLKTQTDRLERQLRDQAWHQLLLAGDMGQFAHDWCLQPIFASQAKLDVQTLAAQQRMRTQHQPAALAAMFAATSLAQMPNFWPKLAQIKVPVTYIAGAHDQKFCRLTLAASQNTPGAQCLILDQCGHNPLLEAPQTLSRALVG